MNTMLYWIKIASRERERERERERGKKMRENGEAV